MNNINILNKCIEELKKDTPNLEYLRGIIETLVEIGGSNYSQIQSGVIYNPSTSTRNNIINPGTIVISDEEKLQNEFLEKYERGTVAQLQ